MKSIQAIIVTILCLVGCRGHENADSGGGSGGPPPNWCEEMGCDYTPGHSNGSYIYPAKCDCPDTTTGGATEGVADSSGGGDTSAPGCELHEYRCNMKQIGVYGSSAESSIRSINPQAGNYGEDKTYACLTVDIVFPESALNSGMLEQACLDACYAEDAGLISQGGTPPSLFYLSNLSGLHNPACVFADVEDLSEIDGYPSAGSAVCAGQATTRIVDQGPATATQCAVAIESCDEWDPAANVAHMARGTTHEIHFDAAFAEALYSGGEWGYLYACDAARYQQILSGGVESWQVVEATSGTLLYSLGLRSGDKDFTIAHTPFSTQYALNSFAALAAAAEQMAGDDQLTLRWKRTNANGALVTHTAELWFD